MAPTGQGSERSRRLSVEERRRIVVDTAIRLFTNHGVHAVGMDRLIAETGLGKMSVYRVFATKDELVGAYLNRLAEQILTMIDSDIDSAEQPRDALHTILDGVEQDLQRSDFRGCPFGNAAAEYDERDHPARRAAHDYRAALLTRLEHTANRIDPTQGTQLARQLAVLIDGAYLNTAHLGPDGPASEGIALARQLVEKI